MMHHRREQKMKVKDLMTSDVESCTPTTNLAAAAKIMWEGDCGAIPVTDDRGKVIGIITDRDICIAAATRSRLEGEIPVQEVMSKTVFTCAPGDDARAALDTMRSRKVRRLPVVGHDGQLAGILSLHDVAVQARSSHNHDIVPEAVLDTFVAITAPATPVLA
jgi:CBS domain-containing protein